MNHDRSEFPDNAVPDVQEQRGSPKRAAVDSLLQSTSEEDLRVARSMTAVRSALSALLEEREFRAITVQHIVDRAGVARATFYAHFRNKDDVLLASFEGMVRGLDAHLDRHARPARLVPLAELLQHFSGAGAVFASLEASGRMDRLWDYAADVLADIIAQRLERFAAAERSGARVRTGTGTADTPVDGLETRILSRMLAGAAIELAKWWRTYPDRMTPAEVDERFHRMARRAVRR